MVKTHRFDIFLLAQSSTADNLDVAYHLMLREQDLLQLCVQWQSKARGIPCDLPLDGLWGPADADLQGFVVGKAPDNPVASGGRMKMRLVKMRVFWENMAKTMTFLRRQSLLHSLTSIGLTLTHLILTSHSELYTIDFLCRYGLFIE